MRQRRTYTVICLIAVLAFGIPGKWSRADASDIEPVLEMTYLKNTDDVIILSASLVYYENRQPVALPGQEIIFSAGPDPVIRLGGAVTDAEGKTSVSLERFPSSVEDEDGMVTFLAGFTGNDTLPAAEWEVTVRDVDLDISLEVIDSVKTITARAGYLQDGETLPAADEDIYFYVSRMFSDLPVGEEFLDDNGEASIEFPDDIPGDFAGYLEVIVRFDDNWMFGTVEKREQVQWGTATHHEIPESYRALWSQIAPLWMIITLSIMLAGVWGHYLFVIIQLVRIRRMGKKLEVK
jgi:hypothetical protein